MGRVTTIGDDSSAVGGLADKLVTYSYDYANQMTRVERGANGGSLDFDTRYAYDGMGRVSEIAHSGAIGSQLAAFNSYAYQYDKAHRIIEQITTRDEAISALSAISAVDTETFTFDDAGQLTDVTATGSDDETYEYDENGNRKEDGVISIGDHNRLDADADWTYTYDREGNLTRRDAQIGSDYTTYEWDNQNRLEKLVSVVGGSTQTIEYRYNAAGQLSSRTTGGQTEHYIYNGSQRVLALDDAGNVLHRYTWGPGVDQLLVDEVFNGTGQVEETLWAANDHLGSVTQLLDDTGTVVEHREYDSFGAIDQVFDETGTEVGSANLRSEVAHTGSFWDDDAALYQKRARWYDAESGRFIGEDPATDGSNWYAYAGNDPVNFIDPTGLAQAGHPLSVLDANIGGPSIDDQLRGAGIPWAVRQSDISFLNTSASISSASSAKNVNLDALSGFAVGTGINAASLAHASLNVSFVPESVPIGSLLSKFSDSSYLHLTDIGDKAIAKGIFPSSSWAIKKDVTELTVPVFKELVVGKNAIEYGTSATRFVSVDPSNVGYSSFETAMVENSLGIQEYSNLERVVPNSVIDVPRMSAAGKNTVADELLNLPKFRPRVGLGSTARGSAVGVYANLAIDSALITTDILFQYQEHQFRLEYVIRPLEEAA